MSKSFTSIFTVLVCASAAVHVGAFVLEGDYAHSTGGNAKLQMTTVTEQKIDGFYSTPDGDGIRFSSEKQLR